MLHPECLTCLTIRHQQTYSTNWFIGNDTYKPRSPQIMLAHLLAIRVERGASIFDLSIKRNEIPASQRATIQWITTNGELTFSVARETARSSGWLAAAIAAAAACGSDSDSDSESAERREVSREWLTNGARTSQRERQYRYTRSRLFAIRMTDRRQISLFFRFKSLTILVKLCNVIFNTYIPFIFNSIHVSIENKGPSWSR